MSPGQQVLRLTIALGPLVALFATVPAGAVPRWWLVLLVAGIAAGFAAYPESAAGAGVFLLVVAWWGIGLRDGLNPWAILAAAGLLASHVAATLASYGPVTVGLDGPVVRRWVLRGVLVLPAAVLTWVVATVVDDRPEPAGIWVAGLACLLVAVVAANVLHARRPG